LKEKPEIINMQSRLIESINVHRLLIAELSFFLAAAVVIISIFGLRNESLLFVVLIFAIYLIISGRVSQFKFVNVEIVMKDIESGSVYLSHHLLIMIINEKIEPISDML